VSFTAVAPVRALAPVALGLLADRAGTVSVFAVVTAFCAAALAVALFALRDPRRRSEGAGHRAS
jgi:Flp pilus assembly protein protease CpaA